MIAGRTGLLARRPGGAVVTPVTDGPVVEVRVGTGRHGRVRYVRLRPRG